MIQVADNHDKTHKSGTPITSVGQTLKQVVGGPPPAWSPPEVHCMFTISVQSAPF